MSAGRESKRVHTAGRANRRLSLAKNLPLISGHAPSINQPVAQNPLHRPKTIVYGQVTAYHDSPKGTREFSRRMENLLTIALEAHNDDLNHHRGYEITVGRDLLDDWTLSIRYGRVGCGYQTQKFARKDKDQIRAIIRERLRRRRSAPKRIGCAFRVTRLDAVPEFDASAWLPDDSIVFRLEPPFP